MALVSHQLRRTFSDAFGPPAAQEAAIVQKKLKQLQVRATELAAQREVIAHLHNKWTPMLRSFGYGIRASFFVPGVVIGTYPQLCERIVADGHEVGNHGWTHVPPSSLKPAEEEEGLVKANETIFKLTGKPPVGYRSPSWDLGAQTLQLLLRHGFLYESSMMANDHEPYHVRQGDVVHLDKPMEFGQETRRIEMPISWSLDDFPHFEFLRTPTSVTQGLMNASGVLENWLDDFEYMRRTCDWGILTYTCHPFVIGRGHRMLMLERLIDGLIEKGAKFLTMEDAARAYLEREQIQLVSRHTLNVG